MFLHDENYHATLQGIIKGASTACVAVAFWGSGGESLFRHWKGDKLRIICNLAQGGTNPKAVRALQKLRNTEVRQCADLHAKLVLTDKKLALGSANVSANGLGLEGDEVATWREAGILSDDKAERRAAADWFEAQWKRAATISAADLRRAEAAWKLRRQSRPLLRSDKPLSLLKQPAAAWKDRAVYFAVFRSYLSKAADKRLKEENAKLAEEGARRAHDKLDVYEGWEATDLPKDPNALIIPIYWGARGKIDVCNAQRPVPELEGSVKEDGETSRLDFTAYVNDQRALGFSFAPADRQQLQKPIADWLASLGDLEGDAICAPVYEFLRWIQVERRR